MQAITPRRVKVYILNGEDWIDNGTGYCTGEIDEKNNIPYFIVRNELDESDIILKAYIEGTTQYQQQQETLIVWTDELGRDIALSFQEPNGCTSLCDFLIEVFQTYQPNISLVAVVSNGGGNELSDGGIHNNGNNNDITELIVGPVELPPIPTTKNLAIVIDLLNQGGSSNYSKDQISNYILDTDYIAKLLKIFEKCETQHMLTNLHYLCDIMKILLMYSNTQIIEVLLDDENILNVVGTLEYDPEFPDYKSNHREYLSDESKFKEVIPIEDCQIKQKIKSTFRLQFLKDVVLAKLIDDATFNLIQTLIYFNQFDVINFLQEPANRYIENLFNMYEDPKVELARKRDGVRMLHQFVLIAKTLQVNQKAEFYKNLVTAGLFKMINYSLQDESTNIRVLCTELIVSIIEHDVMLVNQAYSMKNQTSTTTKTDKADDLTSATTATTKIQNDEMTLMKLLTKLLVEEADIGLKTQAFEAIKVLLDPFNAAGNSTGNDNEEEEEEEDEDHDYDIGSHHEMDDGGIENATAAVSAADEEEDEDYEADKENGMGNRNKTRHGLEHPQDSSGMDTNSTTTTTTTTTTTYLDKFYDQVAPTLFAPLIKLSKINEINTRDDFIQVIDNEAINDSVLFQHLCELVNFVSSRHEKAISRAFLLENNILNGLKNLVHSFFKMQLRLAAIRTIKAIIGLDDEFYTRYIILNDVLQYVTQFDLTVNTLATSTVLSIIEIEDINKETEERKKFYDMIMGYIKKLIKFEEEELIEDVEAEVIVGDMASVGSGSGSDAGSGSGSEESSDNEEHEHEHEHEEEALSHNNSKQQAKRMKSIDDVFTNKLKREVSPSSSNSTTTTTTVSSTVKSKKIKWVKKLFNKK